MPDPTPNAEESLRKLGERLREGFAEANPTQEKTVEGVKDAVRDEYAKEFDSFFQNPQPPGQAKEIKPEPNEPDVS